MFPEMLSAKPWAKRLKLFSTEKKLSTFDEFGRKDDENVKTKVVFGQQAYRPSRLVVGGGVGFSVTYFFDPNTTLQQLQDRGRE